MTTEGHEPLLSAEETNALLDAMRSGVDDGAGQVESVDLTSAERPLRDALGIADACARTMVTAVDKFMLRISGWSAATEELPAEITPYKVVRASVPQGAAVITFKSLDGSLGILTIGPLLVSFILDRRMGAPLGKDAPLEPRTELSLLDRRLLEPVASALVGLFSKHWCDDPSVFHCGPVLAHSADLPMMAQFEPLLQVALRVVPMGMAGDQIVIALTSGAVLRGKGVRRKADEAYTPSPQDQMRMADALRHAEVEAIAVLGKVRSTVREVLSLQAGDLLRLESIPGEPIELHVGDKLVLFGMPVMRHGNLAMQVSALNEAKP